MEAVFRQAMADHKAGRLEAAEEGYRRSLDWKPAWSLANLGAIYRITGRLEDSEAVLLESLALDPFDAGPRNTLGKTLLQLGKYALGWRHYEARHAFQPRAKPDMAPEWRGKSIAGKHILVVAEQGLGDQILLSRFVPLLAAQGAEVSFAVPKPLAQLFQSLPARVFSPPSLDGLQADVWASVGSVPTWLGVGPADAPAPTLPMPIASGSGGGVGLMLQGGPGNPNPQRLPGPAIAQAIRGLADFVDLDPAVSGARDLAETAAIIAGLERVVTTDTSVAHLAGALGKPCWIIVPRPAYDWYANWRDDRTPWYPSARIIRQRSPGDWAGVIADVAAALSAPPP